MATKEVDVVTPEASQQAEPKQQRQATILLQQSDLVDPTTLSSSEPQTQQQPSPCLSSQDSIANTALPDSAYSGPTPSRPVPRRPTLHVALSDKNEKQDDSSPTSSVEEGAELHVPESRHIL